MLETVNQSLLLISPFALSAKLANLVHVQPQPVKFQMVSSSATVSQLIVMTRSHAQETTVIRPPELVSMTLKLAYFVIQILIVPLTQLLRILTNAKKQNVILLLKFATLKTYLTKFVEHSAISSAQPLINANLLFAIMTPITRLFVTNQPL
jgi:hypothetical protein